MATKKRKVAPSPFDLLPQDPTFCILDFLDVWSLINMTATCKRLRQWTASTRFAKPVCITRGGRFVLTDKGRMDLHDETDLPRQQTLMLLSYDTSGRTVQFLQEATTDSVEWIDKMISVGNGVDDLLRQTRDAHVLLATSLPTMFVAWIKGGWVEGVDKPKPEKRTLRRRKPRTR